MATTPNYGWVMPDPTDFVTNLPADFELFGDAVDDTVKDLNPGTTAGDLDYYTSSTAKARLGIGTAGQVLVVNSGATAPEWDDLESGGETLITSGTLSGASVSVTGIPTTYRDLKIVVRNYLPANNGAQLSFRFNQDSNANRHYEGTDTTPISNAAFDATFGYIGGPSSNTVDDNLIVAWIPEYANTTTWKFCYSRNLSSNNTTPTNLNYRKFLTLYNQLTAITSFTLANSSGNFTSGDYYVYGVK